MCAPVAAMGPQIALAGLGAVGQLAGAGLSMYAADQSGKFNADMSRYQAKLNDQRAARAEQAGQLEAQQETLRRRQIVGSGKTSFAANGLLLDGGPTDAPNLWEQDQAAQLAYDRQVILDNAAAEAWGFRSQAAMDRASATMARRTAKYQMWGAALGGIGGAAGTVGNGIGAQAAYDANQSLLKR